MAKKKKDKTGRVVLVTKDDNILLKQYFAYNESIGVTLTNSEICDQIFKKGLYESVKDMTQ
jgi:hypothetical protein